MDVGEARVRFDLIQSYFAAQDSASGAEHKSFDRLRTSGNWLAFRSESRDYCHDRTHMISVNFNETNEYLTNLLFLPYPILIKYGGI